LRRIFSLLLLCMSLSTVIFLFYVSFFRKWLAIFHTIIRLLAVILSLILILLLPVQLDFIVYFPHYHILAQERFALINWFNFPQFQPQFFLFLRLLLSLLSFLLFPSPRNKVIQSSFLDFQPSTLLALEEPFLNSLLCGDILIPTVS